MRIRAVAPIISLVLWTLCAIPAHAVLIGNFPGLEEMIAKADAVVILRVDRHVDTQSNPTRYTTHDCFIYQTLKGEVSAGKRIQLRLMDTRSSFVTPYALLSTHLMFLTKKRSPNEPTDYRTIEFEGAHFCVPPTENETMPKGKNVRQRIESLLKRSIEYNQEVHENNQAFLELAIEHPDEQ